MTRRMIAVDLGASGGKLFAGAFADGAFSMQEIHRFAHEGVDLFVPDRTGAAVRRTVWDDTLIYRNIIEGLRAYRRDVADRADSLGIDTWGADGRFLDRDGEPLGAMYAYRDHRLDGMIEDVKARIDGNRMYALTGIHFQPFNVSNQLLWFRMHRPELARPDVVFLPTPALFMYYLGGGHQVDSTWASVTQLMDAAGREWSAEILDALDIPAAWLPAIVAPGANVGRLRAELARMTGLNPVPLTAVAAHDTAGAFAAAPVADPATALIVSSGTWSLVGKLIPKPITSPEAMAINASNEGGVGNTRFLKNCMGTWLVQELRRGWAANDGREMPWDDLDRMTESAPPFAALIDPDDPSFYNPDDMEAAIVAFCERTGQPRPEGRGGLARTVYESLALAYRRVNDALCRVTGTTSEVVNIVGGGSRNRLLNQFTADALALPVLAGPVEGTAVGNFMVQAMGLGLIPDLTAARPIVQAALAIETFTPRVTATWDHAFTRFLTL